MGPWGHGSFHSGWDRAEALRAGGGQVASATQACNEREQACTKHSFQLLASGSSIYGWMGMLSMQGEKQVQRACWLARALARWCPQRQLWPEAAHTTATRRHGHALLRVLHASFMSPWVCTPKLAGRAHICIHACVRMN